MKNVRVFTIAPDGDITRRHHPEELETVTCRECGTTITITRLGLKRFKRMAEDEGKQAVAFLCQECSDRVAKYLLREG